MCAGRASRDLFSTCEYVWQFANPRLTHARLNLWPCLWGPHLGPIWHCILLQIARQPNPETRDQSRWRQHTNCRRTGQPACLPSIRADLDLILLTHRSIASSLTLHDDFYIIIIILFRFSSQLQMMFSHGKMSTTTPHSRVSVCLI